MTGLVWRRAHVSGLTAFLKDLSCGELGGGGEEKERCLVLFAPILVHFYKSISKTLPMPHMLTCPSDGSSGAKTECIQKMSRAGNRKAPPTRPVIQSHCVPRVRPPAGRPSPFCSTTVLILRKPACY
ncbi:unnamed protein product [Merluccius merluccius]